MLPLSRSLNCFARVAAGWAVACALLATPAVNAEVLSITGSSSATVIQFDGILPVQSDFAQVVVPLTKAEPPALSTALVDRYNASDELTASGSALALFTRPNLTGVAPPNDVGMDLFAFADDDVTRWFIRGEASETRTIVINSSEVTSGNLFFGSTNRGRSRVILSGVMFITSRDATRDLTGADVKLNVRIERRQFNRVPSNLLEGEIVLSGGPGGSVVVSSATGNFAGAFLPVVDFAAAVEELPLVRSLLFAGLEIPYEYQFDTGLPFELALTVSAEARTIPGGVGASAVFGLPQVNLPDLMQKIANDDRGSRLASAIANRVDTTGAAYQNGGIGFLFPGLCGATGVEALAMIFACACLARPRGWARRRLGKSAAVRRRD